MIDGMQALEAVLGCSKKGDVRRQRPFVTLTYAQSLDGSIAARNRKPLRLSGPRSLRLTHRLRAAHDAILVGINTVLCDDPRLSVRLVEGESPRPIVLDTRLRTPLSAQVLKNGAGSWIVSGPESARAGATRFHDSGATVLPCTCANGRIELGALMRLLTRRNITSLMVEGGAQVITSFLNAGLADLLVVTIAPKLVGGLQVIDASGLHPIPRVLLTDVGYQHLDDDLVLWARPAWGSK